MRIGRKIPGKEFPPFATQPGVVCAPEHGARFYPEASYDDPAYHADVMTAKRLCRRCPHRDACLQWALTENEQFGIWGGLTPRERNDIVRAWRAERRRRRAAETTTPTAS